MTDLRNGQKSFLDGRFLVWFSCGAASAACAKLAVDELGDEVVVVNCDTKKDEHPDNYRFFSDVEQWIGRKIVEIRSPFFNRIEEVFRHRKYMAGPSGAPCTVELKKVPRFKFQWAEDTHMFGMTVEESNRIDDFEKANPDLLLNWILRDKGITKQDCLDMVANAGIELPMMYRLGYEHNNCIGCVKAASPHYWNMIRKGFPQVFESRAAQSRHIGCRLVKLKGQRIFLDELPANESEVVKESLSCGPQCST